MNSTKPRILLCACGLTPQVVTETLYVLLREGGESVPDEVHILTTDTGRRIVQNKLYGAASPMTDLCREFGAADRVRRGMDMVHVLGGTTPLEDIRTTGDNARAGECIFELVRDLVSRSQSLHVSLAGGRKTMGFLLGTALQLLGREQDDLSHVLVAAPFESKPDFFYPPRNVQEYTFQSRETGEWYTLPASAARIELARLPLIRLGDRLELPRTAPDGGFDEAVATARRAVEVPMVTLDLAARTLQVGKRATQLTALEAAVYHAMLDATLSRCRAGATPGNCRWCFTEPRTLPMDLILADVAAAYGQYSSQYERVREQLSNLRDVGGWFRQKRTAINAKLQALPQGHVAFIASHRQYGNSSYGVCLPRNRITIHRPE
ncbi:CRISPR-associated ring nuclease Csm6 [Nitratidesulfovibrio liaohensis]|uniref:CRISPR-associated ring nuclease Csm6 n=1 Tax=Nitratidesulfovibrio liaohensis TaxID=2604158 RepID=UPI001AAF3630|nr:CRISPR-associated ring nuclease Csm6 [Nitratidesulfovibrio liaohensis]